MTEVHLLFSTDHHDAQCKLHGAFTCLARAKRIMAENIKTNPKHTTFFIKSTEVDDAEVSEGSNGRVQVGQASLGL